MRLKEYIHSLWLDIHRHLGLHFTIWSSLEHLDSGDNHKYTNKSNNHKENNGKQSKTMSQLEEWCGDVHILTGKRLVSKSMPQLELIIG